jgi:hypothetical protein
MDKAAKKVAFEPKPLKTGEGWYIAVTYPGDMQEHIPGFCDEAEVKEWLAGAGCGVWLKPRGYEQIFCRLGIT